MDLLEVLGSLIVTDGHQLAAQGSALAGSSLRASMVSKNGDRTRTAARDVQVGVGIFDQKNGGRKAAKMDQGTATTTSGQQVRPRKSVR